MARFGRVVSLVAGVLVLSGGALAAEYQILGKKFLVKDPSGQETSRTIIGMGKELPSDITGVLVPLDGVTLRIITNGGTSIDRTYDLPAGGWTQTGGTLKYGGSTAGEPVKKVLLKLASSGLVLVKIIVRGNVGTDPVDNVPPDPASDGGFILDFTGGDRFCVSFPAGGNVVKNDASQWKVINAATQPGCPAPPTTTSTSTSTTSTTYPPCGDASTPMCDGTCPDGEFCVADIDPPYDCYCFAFAQTCGIAAPSCFGTCAGGGPCISDGGSGCMCAP